MFATIDPQQHTERILNAKSTTIGWFLRFIHVLTYMNETVHPFTHEIPRTHEIPKHRTSQTPTKHDRHIGGFPRGKFGPHHTRHMPRERYDGLGS